LRFGCFFFQRRKRRALKWNVFLVRPSIGEALSNDALSQLIGAAGIVNAQRDTVVIAEIKFSQIAVLMLFRAMLVGAAHTALEH
jgi:hypothetical protein